MTGPERPPTAPPLALAGIKVLDVGSFIAAPAAAMVLGDFGAEVIKVEPPGEGDPYRTMGQGAGMPQSPVNYCWELDSRNKKSVALDLKRPEGRAALDRLIAGADVLITNFPPPVRRRLRLAWQDVEPANPRLVYASLTGYGEDGPDADLPGYDVTAYFSRAGIVDTMRRPDMPPMLTLPAQGDHPTAMALFAGIVLALWQRDRTGKGGWVGTSLLHNGLWSNAILAQAALLDAYPEPRRPRTEPRNPLVNVYRTRDDRWVSLVLVREDKLWPGFCRALGRPDLETDPRFADGERRRANAAELTATVDAEFAKRDWAEWAPRLAEAEATAGLIGRLRDVPHDPQFAASGAIVDTGRTDLPRTVANPIRTGISATVPPGPAPALGQHTDEVLRAAGFAESEIAALRACGAAA